MKHKFIAKRYWKDQSTPMGKVDEMAKEFNDVINLSLGDPDLTTNEIIIDQAYKDARAGHTKYTDFRGDPELRTEICNYYHGHPVTCTNNLYERSRLDNACFQDAGKNLGSGNHFP